MKWLFTTLLLVLASTAMAQEDPTRRLDRLYELEPQTRNSPLIATPEAVKLQTFTGGASFSYGISVPAGTGGATPSLALNYSSLSKNGPYGWGWTLNLSRLERCTRFGPPTYNNSQDIFELDGEVLVRDPQNANRFYKRSHDFTRIVYTPATNTWKVTSPDGTVFKYGEASRNARIESGSGTFRWALDEVIDTQGNSYRIEYKADNGEIYPERIRYSYHASAGPNQSKRLVLFKWTDRRNNGSEDQDRPTSYRGGFKQQIALRLDEIITGIDNNNDGDPSDGRLARYRFEYANKTSASNERDAPFSKLLRVQRFGSDNVAFPKKTIFQYSDPQRRHLPPVLTANGTAMNSKRATVPDTNGSRGWQNTLTGLWDMNGDGINDHVSVDSSTKQWTVWLGLSIAQGGPGYALPVPWRFCNGSSCNDAASGNGVPGGSGTGYWQLGVSDTGSFSSPTDQGTARTVADIVDMNGDGYPDRVTVKSDGSWRVRFNQAWNRSLPSNQRFAFGSEVVWGEPNIPANQTCSKCTAIHNTYSRPSGPKRGNPSETAVPNTEVLSMIIDVNGDGLPDHMTQDLGTFGNVWISINNGCEGTCGFEPAYNSASGFAIAQQTGTLDYTTLGESYAFVVVGDSIGKRGNGQVASIADINSDGFPDRILSNINHDDPSGFDPCWTINFGNGSGFFSTANVTQHCWGDTSAWDARGYLTSERFAEISPVASILFTAGSLIDLNGDGVVDRVGQPATNTGDMLVRFGLGDGRFTSDDVVWNGLTAGELMQAADHSGDGLIDAQECFSSVFGCGQPSVRLHPGAPGLLTKVTNEFGGITKIRYKNSADAVGNVAVSSESLPASTVPLRGHQWVVDKIWVNDGRSDPNVTNEIKYFEPRYDNELRENFGFRMAQETDAIGTYSQTQFSQKIATKGRVQVVDVYKNSGARIQSSGTAWPVYTTETPGGRQIPGSTVAFPELQINRIHIGNKDQVSISVREFDTGTGNLTSETDAGGDGELGTSDDLTREFTYATNVGKWLLNYPVTVVEKHGASASAAGTTIISYDGQAWPTAPTKGNVTGVTRSFDSESLSDSWTYDAFGNVKTYNDPRRNEAGSGSPTLSISYETGYNTFPLDITNRRAQVSHYAFDTTKSEVTHVLGPNGDRTCRAYDGFGRLTSIREHSTSVSSASGSCDTLLADFSFNNIGLPSSQHILQRQFPGTGTGALEGRRYFNGLGRVYHEESQATANDFTKVSRAWDNRGQQICETLPYRGGNGTRDCLSTRPFRQTIFEASGRPTAILLGEVGGGARFESTTTYVLSNFDGRGEEDLVAVIRTYADPSPDRLVRIARDSRGEVVEVRENGGGDTTLVRDARSRVIRVDGPDIDLTEGVDNNGIGTDTNIMQIAYDFLGRRKSVTLPGSCSASSGRNWTFSYDSNGNLDSQTSPAGITLGFDYDNLDRIERKRYPDSAKDHIYSYDTGANGKGRLASVRTPSVTTRFVYTLQGDLDKKTREFGVVPAMTIDYSYDKLDRRTSTTYPDGNIITFVYSGLFPSQVIENLTVIADGIQYHASGALSLITHPGDQSGSGSFSSYQFDPSTYRPTVFSTVGNGEAIQGLQLFHDLAGNPTRTLEIIDGEKILEQNFDYDKLHRLEHVDSSGTLSYPTIDYEYDDAGNIRKLGLREMRYGCSEGGPHAVTEVFAAGLEAGRYLYDRDGAVVERKNQEIFAPLKLARLIRDDDGRIAHFIQSGGRACYEYDETGQRSTKDFSDRPNPAPIEVDRLYVDPEYEVDLTNDSHQTHVFLGNRRMATILRDN